MTIRNRSPSRLVSQHVDHPNVTSTGKVPSQKAVISSPPATVPPAPAAATRNAQSHPHGNKTVKNPVSAARGVGRIAPARLNPNVANR